MESFNTNTSYSVQFLIMRVRLLIYRRIQGRWSVLLTVSCEVMPDINKNYWSLTLSLKISWMLFHSIFLPLHSFSPLISRFQLHNYRYSGTSIVWWWTCLTHHWYSWGHKTQKEMQISERKWRGKWNLWILCFIRLLVFE